MREWRKRQPERGTSGRKCMHPRGWRYHHTCWWTFTAQRNGVFYATPGTDMYMAAEDKDGNSVTGADLANYGKAYFVKSGEPLYISIKGSNTVKFDAEYETADDTGLDPDRPAWLIDGVRTFLGSADGGYEKTTSYATYTAVNSGVLILHTYGYVSNCSVNDGPSANFSYQSTGGYVYKLKVNGGETYKFKFENYNPFVITPTMTYPEKGSIDNPFEMADGENTVPAAAGMYYYTFAQPNGWGGNAAITSAAELPEGKVSVYENMANIGYNIVYKTSETGKYDVNFETQVRVNPTTFYIVVDKKTATADDDKFNFKWTRYAEGSDRDNPHIIAEFPFSATTDADFTSNT